MNILTLYDQTTFSDKESGTHGDCFRACVATLLQIDPVHLPHPIAASGEWSGAFFPAIRKRGFIIRNMEFLGGEIPDCEIVDERYHGVSVPRIVMAAGPSPRDVMHSVLFDRTSQRVIHDPHPSRAGLVSIESFDYLAPIKENTNG